MAETMNILPILNTKYGIREPRLIINVSPKMPTEHTDGSPIRIGDMVITLTGPLCIATATPYDDYRTDVKWEQANRFDTQDAITELRRRGDNRMADFVRDCNP